jgi:hypothetical protein
MKTEKISTWATLAGILVIAALSEVGFGASGGFSKGPACSLPWPVIAEKVREGLLFCENRRSMDAGAPTGSGNTTASLTSDGSYVHRRNQTVSIRTPTLTAAGSPAKRIDVEVTKWENNSWRLLSVRNADSTAGEIRLVNGLNEEGFFKLQFAQAGQDGEQSGSEVYAIVCDNWKKDFLAFCRQWRDELEYNPDASLVFSSIAVSHFDHTMEMVGPSDVLSWEVLKALAEAVRSEQIFATGQCPDLVVGLNRIRLRRFEGAEVGQFAVFVPDSYDSSRKWPLYLYPDAKNFYARSNYAQRSGFIDVWWTFRGWKDFDWKDYQHILTILRSKLNLDEDRFYLYGHCGNGIPAMALALNYPDQWAECSTLLGNSYRHLAGNALNLPVIFIAGRLLEGPIAGYSEFAVKCFQYYGCKHFKCGREDQVVLTRGSALPEAIRERNPQRVLYTVESLRNPRAYWIEVLGRHDENYAGTIDAEVSGQTVLVKTKNIDAYRLCLSGVAVDSNRPVEVVENGRSLGHVRAEVFTRQPEAYKKAAYIKNERIRGPIGDAFTDAYVVVWGANDGGSQLAEISKKTAVSLAHGAPCFSDANMPPELLESHNLILVGTAESNRWLAKVSTGLPVQIEAGQIVADGKRFSGSDIGFILVYPNPLNPKRYVQVFSATSSVALDNISRAYLEIEAMAQSSDVAQHSDVAVFEVTERGEIRWYMAERLSTLWDWHSDWKEVLASTGKKHPKWQWRQWAARILRQQLEADVVICEDPLRFKYSVPEGRITYRDLFNGFRNDWLVKIRLTGKTLRNLLSAQVTNISNGQASMVVTEGISFVKPKDKHDVTVLGMDDLKNDKTYVAALSYTLVNGERLGMVLKDYEIVGEGYMVPLLGDYLRKNRVRDIDAQLDSIKLTMF